RWSCVNWIDKVLLTAPSVQPIYWHPDHTHVAGWGKCRPIPGLPDRHGYDGITVIAGIVILWRGTTFKWSDSNDFAQWIPVRTTASTGRALVATTFTRPSPTSTTDWVYLSEASGSFVPNQFIRVVSHEDIPDRISYSYYTVSEVATAGEASSTVNFEITVPAGGTARVYL